MPNALQRKVPNWPCTDVIDKWIIVSLHLWKCSEWSHSVFSMRSFRCYELLTRNVRHHHHSYFVMNIYKLTVHIPLDSLSSRYTLYSCLNWGLACDFFSNLAAYWEFVDLSQIKWDLCHSNQASYFLYFATIFRYLHISGTSRISMRHNQKLHYQ